MTTENRERGEMTRNLLSNSNVGEQHELFDHVMSVDVLVLRDISGVLSLDIELELDLRGGERQGSILIPFVFQGCCNFKKASESLCERRLIRWVVHHILGLVVAERLSGSDYRLSELDIDGLECDRVDFEEDRERTAVYITYK